MPLAVEHDTHFITCAASEEEHRGPMAASPLPLDGRSRPYGLWCGWLPIHLHYQWQAIWLLTNCSSLQWAWRRSHWDPQESPQAFDEVVNGWEEFVRGGAFAKHV